MYQLKQEAISAAFHHLWGHCQEWGACRSSAVYFSPSSLLKIILNLGCGGCPRMCFFPQGGGVISVWWRLAWERNGTVMLCDPINPLLFLTVSPCRCTRRRGFGGCSTAPRLTAGWVGLAHTAWTADLFGRDVPSYPVCLLAVPSPRRTTLQELVWLHRKLQGWGGPPPNAPCVMCSESTAALMARNLLMYSQKVLKAILVPFAQIALLPLLLTLPNALLRSSCTSCLQPARASWPGAIAAPKPPLILLAPGGTHERTY